MRVTRLPIFDIRHRSCEAWSRYLFVNRALPAQTMGRHEKKGPSLAQVTLRAHFHLLFGWVLSRKSENVLNQEAQVDPHGPAASPPSVSANGFPKNSKTRGGRQNTYETTLDLGVKKLERHQYIAGAL